MKESAFYRRRVGCTLGGVFIVWWGGGVASGSLSSGE